MASGQLPNYLVTHRKRLGLTQDEVAFLLGATSGAKASRYERFTREPGFRAALACEVVFDRPLSEIFAGLYSQIQAEVAERAKQLVLRTEGMKPGKRTARKLGALHRIASAKPHSALRR